MLDRAGFKQRVLSGPCVEAPLCLDPLTARLVDRLGFEAGYVSGGALGYALAVSEALLTITELADVTTAITRRADLPLIVDINVGFGAPVQVTRAVRDLEAAGAAALELEDQVAPKRVSHHRGIEHLVSTEEMVEKIRFACQARDDPDLLLIARTSAVRHEGFDRAIERGRAYIDAGADLLLLHLADDEEWRRAAGKLAVPLVAIENLNARTPEQWSDLGAALVLDPYTGQVVAFDAVRRAYQGQVQGRGSGFSVGRIQELYRELPDYAGLEELYDIERSTTERGT